MFSENNVIQAHCDKCGKVVATTPQGENLVASTYIHPLCSECGHVIGESTAPKLPRVRSGMYAC